MIRFIMLCAILAINCFSLYCQNFEGKIVYHNTYKSKLQGVPDEKLAYLLGATQEYFIKGGNYKSLTDGQIITLQEFDPETNKIYNKRATSDTLYWIDAANDPDELVSSEIKKNAETILGNACDALIIKTRTGRTIFYYSTKFKLNGAKFTRHKYGKWAFFCTATGCLPLKMIIENGQFVMESTATQVDPMKLQDDIFSLHKRSPLKQM